MKSSQTTLEVQIPLELAASLRELIDEGWYGDTQSIVVEALRRFLDSHSPALTQQFVQEDVDWGLHGSE